jgi:hypothetical protein
MSFPWHLARHSTLPTSTPQNYQRIAWNFTEEQHCDN